MRGKPIGTGVTELVNKLEDAIQQAATIRNDDDFEAVLILIEGTIRSMRQDLKKEQDLSGVQGQMDTARKRLDSVVMRRPSYSSLPPAAQHFRDAGDKVAKIPIAHKDKP